MIAKYFLLIFIFFIPFFIVGQTPRIGRTNNPNMVTRYIFIDAKTKTKYRLDSTRIMISAVDSFGNLLWITDPWKDNKLPEYRTKRPQIIYFYTVEKKVKKYNKNNPYSEYQNNPDFISISYNNSQFGYLLKKDGSFKFMGQD